MIPESFFTALGTGAAVVVLALPERHQVRARRALERIGATPLRWPLAVTLACVGTAYSAPRAVAWARARYRRRPHRSDR